jgi:hypothetical protein
VTWAGDQAPSEHDETTYENPFQVALVAMVAGNHPVKSEHSTMEE